VPALLRLPGLPVPVPVPAIGGRDRSCSDVPFGRFGQHRGFDACGFSPRARRVQGRSLPRPPENRELVQLRAAARCLRQPVNPQLSARGVAPTKPARCRLHTKRKDITMSNNSNRPSHRIYAVTKNGERSNWREIGAAWAHRDGEGFNLKLAYLPLNGGEIVIRKPKAEKAEESDAASAAA
jgi:hypothetical protein